MRRRGGAVALETLEGRMLLDGITVISSPNTASVDLNAALNFTVTTDGSPFPAGTAAPTLTEIGRLPAGVHFVDDGNGTGSLYGVPVTSTAGGVFGLTFKATFGAESMTQAFTLHVNELAVITSQQQAVFNDVFGGSVEILTTGGEPATTLAVSGTSNGLPAALPAGVTFTPGPSGAYGALTILRNQAVPPTPGYYDASNGDGLVITATTAAGVTTQYFSLTIDGAPTISVPAVSTFTVNQYSSITITTAGYPEVYLQLRGGLPSGLVYTQTSNNPDNAAATISGVPTQAGSFKLALIAGNLVTVATNSISQAFTINVDQAPAITSVDHATFSVGRAGTFTIATGGFPAANSFTETGSLPTGVTLNPTKGVLSGTPAAGTGGVYDVTLTATSSLGHASELFVLTVQQLPVITSGAAAAFTTGVNSSFDITTTGFPAAQLSESGALPKGLSFTNNGDGTGTIAGMAAATAGGKYTISLYAANSYGTVSKAVTLTVAQPPTITAGTPTFTATENKTISPTTIALSGYPTPIAIVNASVTGLPAGLTLTANSTGTALLLTGKPTVMGDFTVTLLLSNVDFSGANASHASFTIDIAA